MKSYISLLRGINVSGQKKIKMDDLKELFESLGLQNVKTFIQSGNVVFISDHDKLELTKLIEDKIKDVYQYDVKVLIRDKDEMKTVIDNNPFLDEEGFDIKKLYVTFLSDKPDDDNIKALLGVENKDDMLILKDKEVYIYTNIGYGKTKFSNSFIEKKLKVKATTRNWNSINKIYELM